MAQNVLLQETDINNSHRLCKQGYDRAQRSEVADKYSQTDTLEPGLSEVLQVPVDDLDHSNNKEDNGKLYYATSKELRPVFSARTSESDLKWFPSECCRICHEKEDVEFFISPCYCRGTMLQVHRSCLETWLAESDSNHCELCGYRFSSIRIPKYDIISSIFVWLTNLECIRDRRMLLCDFFVVAGFSPVIFIFTLVTLRLVAADLIVGAEDEGLSVFAVTVLLQSALLGLLFLVDLSFVSWFLMRCDLHIKNWYRWYRSKSTVILLDWQGPSITPTPSNVS